LIVYKFGEVLLLKFTDYFLLSLRLFSPVLIIVLVEACTSYFDVQYEETEEISSYILFILCCLYKYVDNNNKMTPESNLYIVCILQDNNFIIVIKWHIRCK